MVVAFVFETVSLNSPCSPQTAICLLQPSKDWSSSSVLPHLTGEWIWRMELMLQNSVGYCLSIYMTLTIQNGQSGQNFHKRLKFLLMSTLQTSVWSQRNNFKYLYAFCYPDGCAWLHMLEFVTIPRGRDELFPVTDYFLGILHPP